MLKSDILSPVPVASENLKVLYPSGNILRKMGIADDQDGIMRRYIREAGNWAAHLERTKKFIISAVTSVRTETVVVLGSGWMLDVPAEFLLQNFKKVMFCDIRHPKPVVQKYRKYPNAEFISIDLTGGLIERAYRIVKEKKITGTDQLQELLKDSIFELPFRADYIVSVNLLNQLDILIVDYLKGKLRMEQQGIEFLRENIQKNHLHLLPLQHSCLVTDYEEVHISSTGKEAESVPLLFCGLPEGSYSESWIWEFDTHRTYNPRWNTRFRVKAIRF